MLFVSFPAADVAADAVHKLTNSTVDSKELFIKVLPNIHVSSNSSAALFINMFSSILYNLRSILRAFNESFKNEVRFRRTRSSSAYSYLVCCASDPGNIKIQ